MGGAITQVQLGYGGHWLQPPAARSVARISRQIGHNLQITEAGRTWAQQNAHYQRYLRYGFPIALHPDTPSVHQLGGAIDSDEAQRILPAMTDHGWRRTVYRKGQLVEPWHFEYFEHLDNHRGEFVALTQGADGVWRIGEEDDMFTDADRHKLDNVYAAIFHGGPSMADNGRALMVSIDGIVKVVDRISAAVGPISRIVDGQPQLISLRQEVADAKTNTLELLGRPTAQVDVEATAAELLAAMTPLLLQRMATLTDEEVSRIAKAAADEEDRRSRERLA